MLHLSGRASSGPPVGPFRRPLDAPEWKVLELQHPCSVGLDCPQNPTSLINKGTKQVTSLNMCSSYIFLTAMTFPFTRSPFTRAGRRQVQKLAEGAPTPEGSRRADAGHTPRLTEQAVVLAPQPAHFLHHRLHPRASADQENGSKHHTKDSTSMGGRGNE